VGSIYIIKNANSGLGDFAAVNGDLRITINDFASSSIQALKGKNRLYVNIMKAEQYNGSTWIPVSVFIRINGVWKTPFDGTIYYAGFTTPEAGYFFGETGGFTDTGAYLQLDRGVSSATGVLHTQSIIFTGYNTLEFTGSSGAGNATSFIYLVLLGTAMTTATGNRVLTSNTMTSGQGVVVTKIDISALNGSFKIGFYGTSGTSAALKVSKIMIY